MSVSRTCSPSVAGNPRRDGSRLPARASALAAPLPARRRHAAVAVRSAPSAASYRGRRYHRPSHTVVAASPAPAILRPDRRRSAAGRARFPWADFQALHSTCASMSSLCILRLRRGGWSSASQSAGDCFKPSRPRFSVHPVMEIRFRQQAAGHGLRMDKEPWRRNRSWPRPWSGNSGSPLRWPRSLHRTAATSRRCRGFE